MSLMMRQMGRRMASVAVARPHTNTNTITMPVPMMVRGFAVETGCRVSMRYAGKDHNTGEDIFGNAEVTGQTPMTFEVGKSPVLPGLHDAVLGMEVLYTHSDH